MKTLPRIFAAFAAVCLLSTAAFAADPSGTWKWTQQGRGGGGGGGGGTPREASLTLAMKGTDLTGKLTMPGRDGATNSTDISNGSVKGDVVAFSVEREFNGNKFVTKYSGKLAGDTITGESESPGRDGQTMKREWVAKRAK
jgi:hypothetical protein